ncbi:MAG: hypothetical protein JWN50_67 [Parcubacteria group bacterium]|nr:hypothetical protein [Parcubacteria group bacterium]
MNRKPIIIGIIAIIIVLIAVFAFRSGKTVTNPTDTTGSTATTATDVPSVPDANGRQFVDSRFTFVYPKDLAVTGAPTVKTKSWRQNATTTGFLVAVVSVPKSFMPGTNFSDAKFTVGVSTDKAELSGSGCPSGINFSENGGATAVPIHNQTYTKITQSGAGAGNLYETTSYFTIRDGSCYALEYTIHSTNLGNYDPSQGITAFDKTKITALLDTIVRSFTFTVSSNS